MLQKAEKWQRTRNDLAHGILVGQRKDNKRLLFSVPVFETDEINPSTTYIKTESCSIEEINRFANTIFSIVSGLDFVLN